MTINNNYMTRDIGECAALITSKQHLLRMEKKGRTCWFIFENPQKCSQISNDYFFGELKVNAREFHQTIGHLKNIMYAGT